MRTKSTGGFTLIELLIVIAIIGILAAVLIPNLLSARQRAQDTAAQSCAREILTKAEIYMIDEGEYPAGTSDAAGDMTGDYAPGCSNVQAWEAGPDGDDANIMTVEVTSISNAVVTADSAGTFETTR